MKRKIYQAIVMCVVIACVLLGLAVNKMNSFVNLSGISVSGQTDFFTVESSYTPTVKPTYVAASAAGETPAAYL